MADVKPYDVPNGSGVDVVERLKAIRLLDLSLGFVARVPEIVPFEKNTIGEQQKYPHGRSHRYPRCPAIKASKVKTWIRSHMADNGSEQLLPNDIEHVKWLFGCRRMAGAKTTHGGYGMCWHLSLIHI